MKGSSWASGSVGMCDQMWTALVDVRGEAEAGSLPEKKIPHRGEHRQEVGEKLGCDKVV